MQNSKPLIEVVLMAEHQHMFCAANLSSLDIVEKTNAPPTSLQQLSENNEEENVPGTLQQSGAEGSR